ncbi:hypothetical protein Hsw_1614 [Hymenobacter swuensis DY53]|uniref:Uncharacterized protein n=1 Tax=Hymenobacter swuensis DY53 TaxID=1227739 RepID=W8EVG0_9BACT|nr:hypothetical protein Hsw_1614 [Hymenobacter swuensis DY53]
MNFSAENKRLINFEKILLSSIDIEKINTLPLSRSKAVACSTPLSFTAMRRHFINYQPMLNGLDRKIQPGFGAQARR